MSNYTSEFISDFGLNPERYKAKDNLNDYSSSTLFVPLAKMDSVSRLDMAYSALRNLVVPSNPEAPIVASAYADDILFSTDNKVENGGVELLHRIDKIINGTPCVTTYIYRALSTDQIKMVHVPTYQVIYKFGYPMTSVFEEMKPGDKREGKCYVKHYKFLDTQNGIVKFGVNVPLVFTTRVANGEDAAIITKELAEKFTKPHEDKVEFIISPDYIMRNLYGDDEIYKPIPLPGDTLKDGLISAAYTDDNKSFLAYNDNIPLDSDIKTMVQYSEAKVVDIEIFSKNPIDRIETLEVARQEYRNYMSKVCEAIKDVCDKYPEENIHVSLPALRDKYSKVLNISDIRMGTKELKNSIYINIYTVYEKPLEIGDKITNLHGGKNTISKIVDKPWIVKRPGGIDLECHGQFSTVGLINRENAAQLFEHGMTFLWSRIREVFILRKDFSLEKKKKILLSFLYMARQYKVVDYLKNEPAEELIKYYSDTKRLISLTYLPYDDPKDNMYMNLAVLCQVTGFVRQFVDTGPAYMYEGDIRYSRPVYLGHVFYIVLNSGPSKSLAMRGDDGVDSRGNPTKIAKSKKTYNTKYGTNAAKYSDMSLSTLISCIHPNDKSILRNNCRPLHDFMRAMQSQFIIHEYDDNNQVVTSHDNITT